jgi:hypothetical protein
MIIPIQPDPTKAFAIVDVETETRGGSPRERFEQRAAEIARAAETHARRMMEAEADLLANGPVPSGIRAREPETRDAVPFGLRRRVVLRVPVFREGSEKREVAQRDEELRKIRRLMAQVALDLIAQILEINRYFAEAGLVRFPELGSDAAPLPEAAAEKTMSGPSEGSSLRRRA